MLLDGISLEQVFFSGRLVVAVACVQFSLAFGQVSLKTRDFLSHLQSLLQHLLSLTELLALGGLVVHFSEELACSCRAHLTIDKGVKLFFDQIKVIEKSTLVQVDIVELLQIDFLGFTDLKALRLQLLNVSERRKQT